MQKELQIFSMASVAGDMYKSRYDKANEKRKAARKDLKANFLPGSARFKGSREKNCCRGIEQTGFTGKEYVPC